MGGRVAPRSPSASRSRAAARGSRSPAVALAVVVVAGLLSPPGRAVLDEIREVVGVEEAQPALFSLPAPGRLLVTADSGAWVVDEDGSKRLLGDYREASWSPFGRFVVATRANELVALEPDGTVRWSLARPDVRLPRWGGTQDRHADRVLLARRSCGSSAATARATACSIGRRRRNALPCGCPAAATGSRTHARRHRPRRRRRHGAVLRRMRRPLTQRPQAHCSSQPASTACVAGRPLDRRRLAGRGSARLHPTRPAEADPGGLGRVRPVPLALVSEDRGWCCAP